MSLEGHLVFVYGGQGDSTLMNNNLFPFRPVGRSLPQKAAVPEGGEPTATSKPSLDANECERDSQAEGTLQDFDPLNQPLWTNRSLHIRQAMGQRLTLL